MVSLLDVQRGYDEWAAKPHNAKWVRKIDGTPIANDIVCCIFNHLSAALSVQPESALQTAIYRLCLIEASPNLKEGEKSLLREWITELRAAAPSAPEGWQSIDSAPRDKTPVIIAVPTRDRDDFIVGEAYFDPEHYEDGDWWWAGTSYGDWGDGPISDINHHGPSHWRPMPSPPFTHSSDKGINHG